MAELHYPLYDTALFGTSAGVEHTLFTNGQGSLPTKGKTITNMRGNGQLPDKEMFTIYNIGVHIDDVLSDDDIQGLFLGSLLTIEYNNVKVMEVPLYKFSDRNAVSGVKTESSASAFDYFGQEGMGMELRKPLLIKGGKNFKVLVYQGLAVDNASMDIKFVLDGILDTPDITV